MQRAQPLAHEQRVVDHGHGDAAEEAHDHLEGIGAALAGLNHRQIVEQQHDGVDQPARPCDRRGREMKAAHQQRGDSGERAVDREHGGRVLSGAAAGREQLEKERLEGIEHNHHGDEQGGRHRASSVRCKNQ